LQRNFHEGGFIQFINRFNYCEMKKLVLFAAVIVAISLSACKKAAPAEAVPEEVITVVDEPAAEEATEVVADSTAAVVEEAAAE
jgi:hypothetical protein